LQQSISRTYSGIGAEEKVMGKDIKILVVDDFATMRKVLRNLLKQGGYENVMEAADGIAALQIIKTEKIDFIISDWNMPNMSGLDLLKSVRADKEVSNTPFLMVTAETLPDRVISAVRAGASSYITKPFTADVLNEKIAKIIEKMG
jgi:two-component system, chemotaxis family, chemotaxis protein CheY